MPSFPKGRRFLQLLLRREDLAAMRTQYIFPVSAIAALGLLGIAWRLFPLVDTRLLADYLAAGGISCSLFLAYKLYLSDQRRRKAESRARTSEFKFDQLYQSGMIGLWVTGTSGVIVEANDAFLKMIGYTRTELAAGLIDWKAITAKEYQDVTDERLALLREKS